MSPLRGMEGDGENTPKKGAPKDVPLTPQDAPVPKKALFSGDPRETILLLVDGLANDFSNLLNAIAGNIYIAKEHLRHYAKIHEALVEAEQSTYRAKELINQLRMVAPPTDTVRRDLNLGDIIETTVRSALKGSEIEGRFACAEDLWTVHASEEQIRQVIQNIVVDVRQTVPAGGSLRVEVRNARLTGQSPVPVSGGRYVRVVIEYVREPAAPDRREQDEPSRWAADRGPGTGISLGLVIAYAIIREMGGHILMDALPESGTSYSLYFPASRVQQIEKEKAENKKRLRGTVLIMDDEELDRMVAGEMLGFLKYGVEFARDGEEAIALFLKRREAGRPFDLVILDMVVSGGMGGKEAVRKLLEIDPEVKAIVCSGYSDEAVSAHFESLGFRGVLPKPYRLEEMRTIIEKVAGSLPD